MIKCPKCGSSDLKEYWYTSTSAYSDERGKAFECLKCHKHFYVPEAIEIPGYKKVVSHG